MVFRSRPIKDLNEVPPAVGCVRPRCSGLVCPCRRGRRRRGLQYPRDREPGSAARGSGARAGPLHGHDPRQLGAELRRGDRGFRSLLGAPGAELPEAGRSTGARTPSAAAGPRLPDRERPHGRRRRRAQLGLDSGLGDRLAADHLHGPDRRRADHDPAPCRARSRRRSSRSHRAPCAGTAWPGGRGQGRAARGGGVLRDRKRFPQACAKVPKGILLHGPPGTGKALLAKAVANEAEAKFFAQSASSFVEMFAGLGAARIQAVPPGAQGGAGDRLHRRARRRGGTRGKDISGEKDQTLNQLLVELDGFGTADNVVVIAASNLLDKLDPALLRPGRFDRQILVSAPDLKGRRAILDVHTRGMPLERPRSRPDCSPDQQPHRGRPGQHLQRGGHLRRARPSRDDRHARLPVRSSA